MRFRRFFSLSGFKGREDIPQARMLQFIIWTLLIVCNTQGLVFFILMPQNWERWLAILLTLDFTLPPLLLLNHRGRSRLAGVLLLGVLWVLTTVLALTGGGIHAPIILAYVVNMAIAGLLFGGEGGVMAGSAFCITGLVLVLLEITGHLPESRAVRTSMAMWVTLTIALELSTIFQILANRWIKAALQQAKQEMDRRRQAETALRQSRDELEVRVQERTAELQKANKDLEAFSYSISHDLRSPLRTMTGFADILMSDYAHDLPGDAQNFLARIRDNALRMNQMVEDLLKMCSLDQQPLVLSTVNLTSLAFQTITELRAEHPDRNLDIRLADLPECLADPILVRQVIFNLLANAVKFTGTRPVALIEIGFKKEEGETIYFIRDNGVGFDMQYASKLFGDFQRLHSPTQFPGTGVGLSLVRRIIHRHHGRVWAESAVDKGATFYFTLPGPDQKPDPADELGRKEAACRLLNC